MLKEHHWSEINNDIDGHFEGLFAICWEGALERAAPWNVAEWSLPQRIYNHNGLLVIFADHCVSW